MACSATLSRRPQRSAPVALSLDPRTSQFLGPHGSLAAVVRARAAGCHAWRFAPAAAVRAAAARGARWHAAAWHRPARLARAGQRAWPCAQFRDVRLRAVEGRGFSGGGPARYPRGTAAHRPSGRPAPAGRHGKRHAVRPRGGPGPLSHRRGLSAVHRRRAGPQCLSVAGVGPAAAAGLGRGQRAASGLFRAGRRAGAAYRHCPSSARYPWAGLRCQPGIRDLGRADRAGHVRTPAGRCRRCGVGRGPRLPRRARRLPRRGPASRGRAGGRGRHDGDGCAALAAPAAARGVPDALAPVSARFRAEPGAPAGPPGARAGARHAG